MTPLTESPLTILYICRYSWTLQVRHYFKTYGDDFPICLLAILPIIWLQQMYLYASMFLDSGLHQCLWVSLCSFVGLSFCPSPGAWYADAKKDSCTVLKMQHVLKKVPLAPWLLKSLYVWVQKVSMIVIRYRYTMVLWMGIQPYTV